MRTLFLILFSLYLSSALALDNGLARTPPMGWNAWIVLHCNVSEEGVRAMADAIVDTGLASLGYNYVNIDDCWQVGRNPDGTIIPDPQAFPSGMKALADYVHSKGLKFGLYSDAGYKTCKGRPGSLGYETIDANTYASWGVDYLKYDNCNNDGSSPRVRYPPMTAALNQTGRPILFSMCEWGHEDPATWSVDVGNSWRTTGDIRANFSRVLENIDNNNLWADYAGPGGWNDPDMFEIGVNALTPDQEYTHFSLWAISKAPLLLALDVRNMSAHTRDVVMNKEVIAINQDSLGVQGRKRTSLNKTEIWSGPLANGDIAVLLVNRNEIPAVVTLDWAAVGLQVGQPIWVRDLWKHVDLGLMAAYAPTIAPFASIFLRVSPKPVQ